MSFVKGKKLNKKQSNINFNLELTKNLIKQRTLSKTKDQSIEKKYVCQRFAAR